MLEEAQAKLSERRNHCNHVRPHSAVDDRPAAVFAELHQESPQRFALFSIHCDKQVTASRFALPATPPF
jgi:hypothetical protein